MLFYNIAVVTVLATARFVGVTLLDLNQATPPTLRRRFTGFCTTLDSLDDLV